MRLAHLAVDLAERRREVHDAGTILVGDEVGRDHHARDGVVERHEIEWPLVVDAHELVDRDRSDHLGVVTQHVGDALAPSTRSRPPCGSRTRT